jgi:hypothetical protein
VTRSRSRSGMPTGRSAGLSPAWQRDSLRLCSSGVDAGMLSTATGVVQAGSRWPYPAGASARAAHRRRRGGQSGRHRRRSRAPRRARAAARLRPLICNGATCCGVRPGYVVGDMYTTGPADVLCSTHVTAACGRESIALGADHTLVPAHGDQSAPRVARTFTVVSRSW